jgi:general secretion pathway protein K
MAMKTRQQGAALIIVLMLFAVMVTLATEVMYRQDHFRTRTANLLAWDARYQYAIAAETLAIQALIDDLEEDRNNNKLTDDCIDDSWAVSLKGMPYENAILSASVQDLQARFNLNSLVTPQPPEYVRDIPSRQRLEHLLAAILPQPERAAVLSMEMADWIDSNNLVDEADGAEDAEYRYQRTPNMPILHESEMRALRSFQAQDSAREWFWAYLTALPFDARLNINTAPEPVLDAMFSDTVGNAGTQTVVQLREQSAIAAVADLFGHAPFNTLTTEQRNVLEGLLDVRSMYFQVMVDVATEQGTSRLVTRIRRPNEGMTAVFSRQLLPVLGALEPACNPLYNPSGDSIMDPAQAPPGEG